MTKKRVAPVRKYESATFTVQDTVLKTPAPCMPTNLAEEKEKFLKSGKTPKFQIKDRSKVEELASKTKNQIRFDLLGEAQYILEKVRDQYGNGEQYLEHAFGVRIEKDEATPILLKYISENNLTESIKIHWCDNLTCSAKMVWTGPTVSFNRPELRKYSLWLNGSDENPYMRESGIQCLMDHEIGTHFYRNFNDGFQPWYKERERFGLRKLGAFEGQCSEEGLAAIHTVLRGRTQFLWGAAMAYYLCCKAAEMTFKELFDHLGRYTSNPDYRWKQVMRVKRGLADPNDLGGFGNDQCYFEGAVSILRSMDKIDFQLLMTGKVCYDELDRIKRVARKDAVQYPNFMKNMTAYKKSLRKIFNLNGLDGIQPLGSPPAIYLKHLDDKKRGKSSQKSKKVRSKFNMTTRTVTNKGKNKKSSKTENFEDEDGVNKFTCGSRFINMHLSKTQLTENEKVIKSVTDEMNTVKQLTNKIFIKDCSLEKQIERLQNIVKGHEWSFDDDPYIDSLKEEALENIKDVITVGNECGECTTLPLMHRNLSPSCDVDLNTNSNVNTCETQGGFKSMNTQSAIPERCTNSACTGASSNSLPEDNIKNKVGICKQNEIKGTEIDDNECKQMQRCESASSKDLLKQKEKVTNHISRRSRQLLYTPVADLSSYDSFVANIENDPHRIIEPPVIKKRISLNFNNTTETKISYNRITKKEMISSPSSFNDQLLTHRERICLLDTPDLCMKMNEQNLEGIKKPAKYGLGQKIPSLDQHPDQYQRSCESKNRVSHTKRLVNYRPLSTGSERILKLHWKNFSNNLKLNQQKLKLNLNSNVNNNFATFKQISNLTNSSVQNAFQ